MDGAGEPATLTPCRMKRRRKVLLTLGIAPLVFFLFGFDLDRGELECEQAASHLEECCPELELTRLSCVQKGGCGREEEGTVISMHESECIRDASCDELVDAMICERIQYRIDSLVDGGPTIRELRDRDPICE